MKGIEGHLVVLMISIVLFVVCAIALWAFLSGYLKFGTNLSSWALDSIMCGVCKAMPWGLGNAICAGRGC